MLRPSRFTSAPPASAPSRPATKPTVPSNQPMSARPEARVGQERAQHAGREGVAGLVGDDQQQQQDAPRAGRRSEVRPAAAGLDRRGPACERARGARGRDRHRRERGQARHAPGRCRGHPRLIVDDQQRAAADDHADPVAGHLKAVGETALARRQHVDARGRRSRCPGSPPAGSGAGRPPSARASTCERRRGRERASGPRPTELERHDPRACACRCRATRPAIDRRRPQELQRPRRGEQRRQTDLRSARSPACGAAPAAPG